MHKHKVLFSVPDLNTCAALHTEGIGVLPHSLDHSNRFIEEGTLRETDLEGLFVDIQQKQTFLTSQ